MPPVRGLLSALILFLPLPALCAGSAGRDEPPFERFWAGVGVGGGNVKSLAPAPSAGRGGVDGSIEVGYRVTPNWGLGMELGALAPLSGCRDLGCGDASADFAPTFSRLMAFGEFRARNSGLRLRAGVGMSRYCYARHWDGDAWSLFDTLLLVFDEGHIYSEGSGAWLCDGARRAFGGSVSVGYDWQARPDAPVWLGVRLSAEAARFSASPAVGLPAFRHRAVMLSLHLRVN
jgi:hypothetical protein